MIHTFNLIENINFNREHDNLMYGFVTHTANPLGGDCYDCRYCYIHGIRGMKIRFKNIRDKYSGEMRIYEKVLDQRFGRGDVVFFCDCIDYLHPSNPDINVRSIYEWILRSPNAVFLSLTKNPIRYFDFKNELPGNMILGCTIESDLDYGYSDAPSVRERIKAMWDIANSVNIYHYARMVSIEPILKFSAIDRFGFSIKGIIPRIIAIGYDNHRCKLNEPALVNTNLLTKYLEDITYNHSPKPIIVRKTIRTAWWEK